MSGTGVAKARNLARDILANGQYSVPVDVIDIARKHEIDIRYQSLETSVSGVLVVKDGRPTIGINQTHHPNRQRFTIAHELGHYLLHRDISTVFVDAVYHRDDESSEGTKLQEIEANAFAAELLIPETMVREQFGHQPIADVDDALIRRLAARFEVSAQALTIRLTTLGLIATEPTIATETPAG